MKSKTKKVRKSKYDKFHVGYFPPYKKYYISDGRDNYLSRSGNIGGVVYYSSYRDARNIIRDLKKKGRRKVSS